MRSIPGLSRTWLDRLTAAIDDLADDEWTEIFDGDALRARVQQDRLLTFTQPRFVAVVLKRIEDAGTGLTVSHSLRRAYSAIRGALIFPVFSCLERRTNPVAKIPWGGNGMYWDVVTAKRT